MKKVNLVELFENLIAAWEKGIKEYPGEIYDDIVFAICKELSVDIELAIKNDITVDLVDIAKRFSKAAKYLVNEKAIAYCLLSHLPLPNSLKTEDNLYTLAQVIDRVDKVFPGAHARLERRWSGKGFVNLVPEEDFHPLKTAGDKSQLHRKSA